VNKKSLLAILPFVFLLGLFIVNWIRNGRLPAPGSLLYKEYCANCHMKNGQGLGRLYPPLAGSDYMESHWDEIVCIIRNGMEGSIVVNGLEYNKKMDPVEDLSDIQVKNLVNYIGRSWGNDFPACSLKDIKKAARTCP